MSCVVVRALIYSGACLIEHDCILAKHPSKPISKQWLHNFITYMKHL